jgi:hypothetical protein
MKLRLLLQLRHQIERVERRERIDVHGLELLHDFRVMTVHDVELDITG